MESLIVTEPNLITAEKPEDVLIELSAVLRKHGCVLIAEPNHPFVLAKIVDPVAMRALAVAQVTEVNPRAYNYRKLDMGRTVKKVVQ